PWTVGWDQLHDDVGYTPYEGMELLGSAAVVVMGGQVVVDEWGSQVAPGRGRFIPRSA
ncbi:MAG: dihydropyrimidinase, partial [Acidimicrobiia bacterium]|nr:dihydropyrimidinase [Acidimicrobiia bacterium]